MNMFFKNKLSNGIRCAGETMENYKSVSVAVWVVAGSVYENDGDAAASAEDGISHFIEHMLFKGTDSRSAHKIAQEIDLLGGNVNAFTGKQCTCFYAKVLNENLSHALDLISDIVCHPKLDTRDIEREKGVVLEEIAMVEDSPEDIAHETLSATFFKGDPIAKPVLGTRESVSSFTREDIIRYMDKRYTKENIIITAAGNFEPSEFIEAAEKTFGGYNRGSGAEQKLVTCGRPAGGRNIAFVEKDIEQMNICVGFNGFASEAEQHYSAVALSNAFGGSMSSRLFQAIRENKGLAYSVYSTLSSYDTAGCTVLYAGTGEKQAETVVKLMLDEYNKLKHGGLTPEELERSKKQMKTSVLLGRESTSAHSSAIGRAMILGIEYKTEDELIRRINSVSMEDIEAILPIVCDFENMSTVFVGRCSKIENRLRSAVDSI